MKHVAFAIVVCAVWAIGCAHEDPSHTIIVHPTPIEVHHDGQQQAAVVAGSLSSSSSDGAGIQVLPTKRPDRPAEIIGVIDAHLPMGDHASAVALLKRKAAELGADAVIGVDFAHGEGHQGEPIHLSGLAIRYLER